MWGGKGCEAVRVLVSRTGQLVRQTGADLSALLLPPPGPVLMRGVGRAAGWDRPPGIDLSIERDDATGEIIVYVEFAGGPPDIAPLLLLTGMADVERSEVREMGLEAPAHRPFQVGGR